MPNHFTTGARTEHPEEVRAKISATKVVNYLQSVLDSETAEPGHKLTAAKILLDKTISSLSSSDISMLDKRDNQDPAEVEARLRMLIDKAGPEMLSRLLGERARETDLKIAV